MSKSKKGNYPTGNSTHLSAAPAVIHMVFPVFCLVLSYLHRKHKAYVLCHINTSVSSWGHFLNDTIGLTCKQTSKHKHSISTENTWWQCNLITGQHEQIKICQVLNSFKEASSPEFQLLSTLINLCLHTSLYSTHPSEGRKFSNLILFCLKVFHKVKWQGFHESLGGHFCSLDKQIFYIWESQSFPAWLFLTTFYTIHIINIHKMNYSSLIFWHFS